MTPHTPLSALDPHSPVRLFPDDEFRVVNAVDASKQLAFDLSAIASGTTRTVTIPDASGTMALLERAQTFTKLATFALGLTVAGAALASRGIQDDATARALTLSGSGANSVTIANSATSPVLGTSAGALLVSPAGIATALFSPGASVGNYFDFLATASGGIPSIFARGVSDTDVQLALASKGAGSIGFYTGGGTVLQAYVTHTASTNRYITLTGSNGINPSVGTTGGHLLLAPNSGTVYISAGANSAHFVCLNTNNAAGMTVGVDPTGAAYAFNYNAAAGVSNAFYGNASVNNTGNVYLYQKGIQRLVVSDTEVVANGTTTMILRAKGGTSYGMVVAESPALYAAYYLAVVGGVETARMYSAADGWAFGTGSAASVQVQINHTASANRNITLTGSNGGNPTIGVSGGQLAISTSINVTGSNSCGAYQVANNALATPAGGTGSGSYYMGLASIGIYFGSGTPTVSAAKGSLYLRSDGTTTNNRAYINSDGGTTWTALTTAA